MKIVFFDGEESYGDWNGADGLYGSRHLSEGWNEPIRLFVLFDLLGSMDSSLHPFDTISMADYTRLRKIETDLFARGMLLRRYCRSGPFLRGMVEDDQTPFMQKFPTLPILHMVPIPFPAVWHGPFDTLSAIDPRVSRDLQLLFTEFCLKSNFPHDVAGHVCPFARQSKGRPKTVFDIPGNI